jgi:hypothetical protein
MLGNNADAFFTTPMRTSVLAGGNAAFASGGGMPAPYLSGSNTREFLPMGDDAPAAQIAQETTKLFGVGLPVILGVAALAFFALKRA